MQNLEQQISQLDYKKAYMQSIIDQAKGNLEQVNTNLELVNKNLELYNNSLKLLREVSISCQEETTNKIATIMTRLYQYVFNTTDEVIIKNDVKRNVPNAEILIKTHKGGKEVLLHPEDEEGGGKLDILSLGLRVAGLILFTPKLNKILFVDEPLKNVSSETTSGEAFRERTAEFLKVLCKEYGIQIIMITHESSYIHIADKKFVLSLNDEGYTQCNQEN